MPPPALLAADPVAPRVVVFGLPRSGTSARVAAFVRAASADAKTPPVPLPSPGPTGGGGAALFPYRVQVGGPDAAGATGAFVVADCDGQAAAELLAHPDGLVRGAARGALADAVRAADALVLVVDAAADPADEQRTFDGFHQFLDALEGERAFDREVGGLPVFLTLTKCDLLYLAGDEPTDWIARVERRTEDLRARFESDFGDQLAGDGSAPFLPFGSLDLGSAATATAVPPGPAFAGYADPDGPFGVARLVRRCLPAARAHRDRGSAARRRLRWTVTGAGLLLATLLLGVTTFAATGGFGAADGLADRVRAYQRTEPPASARYADRQLARTRKALAGLRADPGFDQLPDELRAFVDDRVREADAYQTYRHRFQPPRLGPAEVRTQEQIRQLDADLTGGPLAPPTEYAKEWADTEAGRLWAKWRTDLALFRDAETQVHDWYRGLIRGGNQLLLTETPPDGRWRSGVQALFAEAESPPVRPTAVIERSPTVPVLRGKKLTYAPVFAAERVAQAVRDWADTRGRLRHLRDLADALGLTAEPGSPAAVLALPEPAAAGVGSKELAAGRLAALRAAFPPPAYPTDDYPEWATDHFPDAVRRVLDARLQSDVDVGVRHVRRLIAAAVGSGGETPEAWWRVADGLLQEDGLKAWGRLLRLLDAWAGRTPAVDPVRDLADFLRRDRFDVTVKAVTITIPDDLLDQRLVPSGRFVVRLVSGNRTTEVPFRQEGDGERDRPVTRYTFVPDGHAGTFAVRPGDGVSAVLPVRSGSQEYQLVWSVGRSAVYQIDRLSRPPRLEKVGSSATPEVATGVRVTATPPGGLPAVPVLLPDLRPAAR